MTLRNTSSALNWTVYDGSAQPEAYRLSHWGIHKLCATGQTAGTKIRFGPLFDAGLPIGVCGEYIQGAGKCQVKS
jgi:hypothetical protein